MSVTLRIFNFLTYGSICALYFDKHIILTAFFCSLMIPSELNPIRPWLMYGNINKLYKVTFIFTGKFFLICLIRLSVWNILLTYFIWISQLRFSCKVTPRRLEFWTLSITVSSILRRRLFTCLFPNLCIIWLTFFTFRGSWLIFSHSCIWFNSIFKLYSTSWDTCLTTEH